MSSPSVYQAREFNLSRLNGISDRTREMHFKLYEGYVKETNRLTEAITDILKDGRAYNSPVDFERSLQAA